MKASTQSRVYAAYLVIAINDDKEQTYHGPFATEARALEYGNSFPTDHAFHIQPLVIPHAMHLYIETQLTHSPR